VDGTSINPLQTGSEVKLSVVAHRDSEQAINCLGCHVPTMDEQINEGIKWATGDYAAPLSSGYPQIEMKIIAGQPKEDSGDKNGVEFCLRSGCHVSAKELDDQEGITTLEELKAATADQHRNPHNSHQGNLDCKNCHQTHEQSVLTCTQCHNDIELPDGWLAYKDKQAQDKELKPPSN
jgi:hypothetical protein